jgi:hypothetical protein
VILSDLLHKNLGFLVFLEVVQYSIDVQAYHLGRLFTSGTDQAQKLTDVVVDQRMSRVQFEDEKSNEMLVLEQLAHLHQLWSFVFSCFLKSFD